jgi:hypothetical protein
MPISISSKEMTGKIGLVAKVEVHFGVELATTGEQRP